MRNLGVKLLSGAFLLGQAGLTEVTDETKNYKVADGFRLEHIHEVTKEEGSWVAMTVDGEGRLITSDQYGQLYRVTVPPIEGGDTRVEPLDVPVGGAHGLLWHEGVLYISVNETSTVYPVERGVWMVTEEEDGWAEPKLVMPIKTGGEHGIHSMIMSPDQEWVYMVSGNMAGLPDVTDSFPASVWKEPASPEKSGRKRPCREHHGSGWLGSTLQAGWLELGARSHRQPQHLRNRLPR